MITNCKTCKEDFEQVKSSKFVNCTECRPFSKFKTKPTFAAKHKVQHYSSLREIDRCNNSLCSKSEQCKRFHLHKNYRDEGANVYFTKEQKCQIFIAK